ncbi:hypothetical protein HDU79_006025 [Rhizoclosmatium sp. JEL0117]|nr:hypothetical protein HDU79_006025 [Rhizoclosmatium sp. JEL0117]
MLGFFGPDIPLPSSQRQSGFTMPSQLLFRRRENGSIGIFTSSTSSDALFTLAVSADVNTYETLNSSVQQRARLKSLLPLRVASTKYPSFALEFILANQSLFSSSAEFLSVDMYGHRFSLYVTQPPGKRPNDVLGRFSYHSTDYVFTRAYLQTSLLGSLDYSESTGVVSNAQTPGSSNRNSLLLNLPTNTSSFPPTNPNTISGSTFQFFISSRTRKSTFSKEKYSKFAVAEASRPAFYAQYIAAMNDQKSKTQKQMQEMEHHYLESLGRPSSRSSNWEFSTVFQHPHTSSPRSQSSSDYYGRSKFPRGGPSDIPLPSSCSNSSSNSESDNHKPPSSSDRESLESQESPFFHMPLAPPIVPTNSGEKFPVFGAISLPDGGTSSSEAEGLKNLMLLVGSVYAVWSRSVLKPLERYEYH